MATETHDPLHEALSGLRDDVSRASLAPADRVRQRGDQRTRRRRVAAGVGSIAAVAAIAVASAQLVGGSAPLRPAPAATGNGSPTAASSTASPTPTPSRTSRPVVTVTPAPPLSTGGTVPAAYFLPGQLWEGPDLNHGHAMMSVEPKETEGSATRFACDPPTPVDDVAFLQVVERSGLMVGTQKVMLTSSMNAGDNLFTLLADEMPTCQRRLREAAKAEGDSLPPGETAPVPDAEVLPLNAVSDLDLDGATRAWRTTTDYGTGAGSRLVEYVVLVRMGAAVSFLSLPQFEQSAVTVGALRRLADEARQQMRYASPPSTLSQ